MRRPHSVAVMMSFGLHRRRVMIRRPCGHWSGVVVRRRVARVMMVRIIVSLCYNASATTSALGLQCLWGEVSSVYSLYARRAAALFAARDSDRCGRSYGELLSAASSRTLSTECGFAKAKPGKQAIAAARPGTRNELVRAGGECSFLATQAFRADILCRVCAVLSFEPNAR